MRCNVRIIRWTSAAVAACGVLASAPASAQGVKIGILNDQSGVYADYGGKGSIEAAKMAIEDFGGSVLGQKIDLVSADHQNKPDLATSIARRWYDAEGVRHDHRPHDVLGCACCAGDRRSRRRRSISWSARRHRRSRARRARPTASTGPLTRTRSPSRREARW